MTRFWLTCFLCVFLTVSAFAKGIGYSVPDKLAKQASGKNTESVVALAKYFNEHLKTDEQKARAAAMFIVYQMEKDGYREKRAQEAGLKNQPLKPLADINEPLKTRIGTSADFAKLFQQLTTEMGLESKIITGYAGKKIPTKRLSQQAIQTTARALNPNVDTTNYQLQPYEASWNAVKVNGTWKLVDTYWMIMGAGAGKALKTDNDWLRFIGSRLKNPPKFDELSKGKRIDGTYFFTDPRVMIKTHFPTDETDQLLKSPVSWIQFTK